MNQEKEASVGRWQKEFFENINTFVRYGMSEEDAKKLLEKFLYLSSTTPIPPVMETFKDPDALERVGVHTKGGDPARSFMVNFLNPIMKNFKVVGVENLELVEKLMGKYPITLISNHLSHLDAPSIFQLLYTAAGERGKKIAENIVFIAGRLAFEPDFTRLGLYMFDTILVCSKKDQIDNPSLSDIMTKINMRAFRQSQKLQSQGKIISIFPEGTRSRDGRLTTFVDTVYHYIANKIILPISLEGTDRILPTTGFLFNAAAGKLVIGKPVIIGDLSPIKGESFPKELEQIKFPEIGDKKQFLTDNLALLIGANLSRHKHGNYRNLYNGDKYVTHENILISKPKTPDETIAVLGASNMSIAIAAILANKNVDIQIYHPDENYCNACNTERRDIERYPIYKLPPNIQFVSNPEKLNNATLFIQGTNPWEFDKIYSNIKSLLIKNPSPIINVIKGFTHIKSGLITSYLEENYGIDKKRLAVASGASYPDQIMERKISGLEFAAVDTSQIERFMKLFDTGYVFTRPAINPTDIVGVQLGGALKNIYSLAMGLVEGYFKDKLGGNVDNTLFHLSNRFFKEMVAIGVKLGGKPETFDGLSGLTDFMMACFGAETHDRHLGYELILGKPIEKMTNGLNGLKVIKNLIQLNFNEYPVVTGTYDMVIEKKNPEEVITKLEEKLSRVH